MVDAADSKSAGPWVCGGSSPPSGTIRLFSRESLDLTIRDSLIFCMKIRFSYVRL